MTTNSVPSPFAYMVLRYLMLLAPMLLAFAIVAGIQKFKKPLLNEYPPQVLEQADGEPAKSMLARETLNRDRITIAALLELFVLTLLVRPWEFPWRARRWGIAGVVLFVWAGLMMALAQHAGRLMALHALGLVGLALTVFPLVTALLLARFGWRHLPGHSIAKPDAGQRQ